LACWSPFFLLFSLCTTIKEKKRRKKGERLNHLISLHQSHFFYSREKVRDVIGWWCYRPSSLISPIYNQKTLLFLEKKEKKEKGEKPASWHFAVSFRYLRKKKGREGEYKLKPTSEHPRSSSLIHFEKKGGGGGGGGGKEEGGGWGSPPLSYSLLS